MANKLFDFPFYTWTVDYPESSMRVQFGNSYVFVAKPTAPDQRIFTLKFAAMKYFQKLDEIDPSKIVMDNEINPAINFGRLELFYQEHRLWKVFDFPHPVYGTLACRFHTPLQVPEGLKGGNGALSSFELKLIEVP